jgi:hypothetical protein
MFCSPPACLFSLLTFTLGWDSIFRYLSFSPCIYVFLLI